MTTLTQPADTSRTLAVTAARAAWRRRVARIGALIQLAFAALWLARGTLATGWPGQLPIAITLAAAAVALGIWGAITTRGLAPRPRGPAAHRLERAITIATALQLAASCALPVIVSAARRARPHRPHHRGHHRHPPAVAVGQAGHARPPRGWHSPHRCPRRARPHPHRQHPHRRRRTHNRRHPGRRRPRRLPCPGQRSTRHPPACLLNTGCDRPLSRSAKTSCTRPACHPAGRAPAATANTRPPLLRSPDHKTLPRQRNPS